MRNTPKSPIFIVIAGVLALILLLCVHTVKEWEQALILEFGQAKRVENAWGSDPKAGLKFKLPYEKVVTLDRRNLEVDLQKVEVFMKRCKQNVVHSYSFNLLWIRLCVMFLVALTVLKLSQDVALN